MSFKAFTLVVFSLLGAYVHSTIPSLLDLRDMEIKFPINIENMEELGNIFSEIIKERPDSQPIDASMFYSQNDVDATDAPRIEVPGLGIAKGRILTSLFGREFFAFHSIPYAKPPVGDLRFKMPEKWDGEWEKDLNGTDYDASFLRAKCPQMSMAVNLPGGREDCLHISIYTPNKNFSSNPLLPVMFFIHGGSFITGDASLYIPTKLMDRDVVVVVVQYRLGSLGFLASGTPDNPGNMGLMDQVMALRWVHDYISYFGGNPNLVTVFGQSAGSASTSWMLFSPTTTAEYNDGSQLLHGIISESGSALEVWTLDNDPQGSFILQADAVGCYQEPFYINETLKCMRNIPVIDIVHGYLKVYLDDRLSGGIGFLGNCPVVQEDLALNYPVDVENNPDLLVIPKQPLNLIKNGEFQKINVMQGSVRDEGSLVAGLTYTDYLLPNNLAENETFLKFELLPLIVNSYGINDKTGSVLNALSLNFFKNAVMGDLASMGPGLVDMTGMQFLKSGGWTLAQLLTEQNPDNDVYFYSFEFESDDSVFPWYFASHPDIPIQGGITHGDDLLYLYYLPSVMDARQQAFVRKFTKLWTNFAKYGNPTPPVVDNPDDKWEEDVEEWTPFRLQELNFMLITDNFNMSNDFPLRWNYNTIPSKQMLLPKQPALDENPSGDCKKTSNEDLTHGYKSATIALGFFCAFLLCFSVFLIFWWRNP